MDDPFAFITELCHISASQEEHLGHYGFAQGRDGCSNHDANEDSDDPTQPVEVEVESMGIVMVSLPETPNDVEEKKDDSTPQNLFQIPTEGSLLANSEEQQPPVAVDDLAIDEPGAPEPNCTDGDEAVDLGNDFDPFASITEPCHVSDSDDPTQPMEVEVESTGIVIVSLPETPDNVEEKKDDSTPQDLFQTPTEGSLLASSEEQQPPVAADDPTVGGPRAPEPTCTDGDEAVDLGKDSDLGFLEQLKKLGLSKNSNSEAQLK